MIEHLQESLLGKNNIIASTVLVNYTVSEVVRGMLKRHKIPLV